MKKRFCRVICMLLALVLIFGQLPAGILHVHAAESVPDGTGLEGKTISILGDSISTFSGVSNNTDYNSTIGSNAIYYSAGTLGVYREDTWWQQTIDALGLELLVNNSWSGSTVFQPRKGESSVGYGNRCVNLHNDTTGEDPDIIVVFLGTNDFSYYQDTLGTADVDYEALITESGDGSFIYAAPTTTCEAYAIMLHKMIQRYPDAEVYCMTMTARRDPDKEDSYADVGQPTAFNAELAKIIEHFGCTVVDLENCGIDKEAETFDAYMGDGRVHPNAQGMDKISEALISAMLGEDATICAVDYTLTGVKSDNSTATVLAGGSFNAKLDADGNVMNVAVTMNGQDITDSCYADGVITIASVTGDITITATAVKAPAEYRWELEGTNLISAGKDENKPALQGGSVSNGVLTNAYYSLTEQVVLRHDLPWILEFKASGSWSGMVFSAKKTSSTAGNTYLFKTTGTNGFIGFGERVESQYRNYGIALGAEGVDTTLEHTYRLENRIASEGTNMVYLMVDGVDYGAMNHYFVGGTNDQGTTVDWLNGRDLTFSYIGASSHAMNNCALDYIQVWEGGKPNQSQLTDYSGKVISILGASICTFDGYIPVADGFNLQHYARYPQDNLLTDVNDTWWMQVINDLDAKLGINDSWRSTEVYNACTEEVNSGYDGTKACLSSVTRIQNLGSNGTPDVILFFGGTNDITQRRPLGTFDPETAPTEVDLTTETWTTVVDAYTALIMRVQYYYPDAEFVVLLPYSTASNSDAVTEKYTSVFAEICAHYGVTCIDLNDCGISVSDLPDGTHPNAEGMDYITAAVLDTLLSECEMEPGENIVHSVKHELTGAESSLGYYKGVSAGSSFTETISGENVTVTVTMGGVDITAHVYANGTITIPSVTGELVITVKGTFDADGHLQQLPEELCAGTNLWTALEPENIYYTATGWGNNSNSNYSVTIPVNEGDQIWASSFGKSGTNGYTANAVRITWFDENGVLASLPRETVYAEFTEYGYITVPEGAIAVNIPMATDADTWELYILNRAHDYKGVTCTICGAEHPNAADYSGKVISILGDSISTFAGYIPTADGFNLEHLARYPQDNLLTDVNETWWMQTIAELDGKLGINDSWRGSTVSGYPAVTTGVAGYLAAMSNLTQIQNLGSNGTPDVILFYGGTNDLAHTPSLGTFDPATAPTEVDLNTLKWNNLADAYAQTLLRLKHFYPNTQIICLLPTYTTSYYSNDKLAKGNTLMASICEHYGVTYIDLRDCGISTADLPDGIHPDATGMDYITNAVLETLLAQDVESGENIVHSVTHALTGVTSSLGYYKGVSDGKAFVTALTGDDMTVSVTMGGVDITDSVYANGVVNIPSVTGDIVITAVGHVKPIYEDHLQQLPDPYYGVDLWKTLEHDDEYFYIDAWSVHSSGNVYSVTFPVTPGDKIVASSFGAAGSNGATMNGIRITWFDADGVLHSVGPAEVYAEFEENGYLTVPEGAVAVNIPMWTDNEDWELYIWENSYEPAFDLGVHLQKLPDESCAGTNLWTALEPQNDYYTGSGWGNLATGQVWSVTIPVSAGNQIYATSFEKYGSNGNNYNTTSGIRVTYFGKNGILKSVTPGEVYTEFARNGYLTVPEGATAMNIPMWDGSESNECYVLNLQHSYQGTSCTICGATHPEAADYSGKVISILSASTSTFAGYIPVADGFNLEHRPRYPQDNLLTDVNETWWMQVINNLDAQLGINDSWAGSTVSNFQDTNSGDLGPDAAMASLTRIRNLGANGTPDVILFFGAGNDMGRGVTLGSFDPATAPTEVDLTATKWDSFADAYVAAIMRLQYFYPDAEIVVMTTYAMPSYVTAAKLDKYGPVIQAICDHYGVKYVDLQDCGVTFDMLPDNIHPNAEGMDCITADVLDTLLNRVDMTAGENVVYPVTHDLANAGASLHYYKGVSAGSSFTETISGENVTVTVTMGGVDITAHVYANGTITIPSVTGELVITVKGTFDADGHLQQLPENICAGINLWTALTPENIYYTATGWGNTSAGTTWSITFPVTPGDRIWATSLGVAPENGSTANGVRITWFDENGMMATLDRNTVYAEFAKNGYITVPEGAIAVNIPMATDADTWELYILNREHDYSGISCTICGTEHPEKADYSGKVISILGDSISTFAGYIPTADGFNLEHIARYPQDNLLTDVNETWWMQVLTELDAKLGINESWRSTEVGNIYDVEVNSGYEGTKACMASLTRIQNLGSNGTPDVILFYGGTNDITQRRTVGTFDPTTAPTEVDLTSVKWDTVADAYVAAIMRMQYYYPDAQIIAMLPTYTSNNTDAVIERYNSVFAAICEHYGVTYIDLRDCGITTANLPDGTHPDAEGMDYITGAVLDTLLNACEMEPGENVVHSVTHDLSGAESSLGYYKGVSDGKSFTTTVTGENLTVTMGGVDITASVYADGVVNIPNVTGDIVITAEGREKNIYEDHLQQLPNSICAGTNLWTALEPENTYYTASGWGNLSSGAAWSITISVTPGDKLWATSFQAYGANGNTSSTSSGIRVTWFDENGVLKAMSPSEVYKEFAANGCLTAPEGAVAVNIPMWTNDDSNEIYILNLPHTHGEVVTENEGPHGSHDLVTYCTVCGAELSRQHDDGYLPGDINGDGAVNNKDVTRLFQYLSDYDVEVVEAALDVNGDGSVNNKDLTRLFQYLSDYDVEIH